MAKVTSLSEAHLSGRLGDKVYSQYYGSTYVRRLPTVRKEARTPAQVMNQQRFREINRFCKQFKPSLIAHIWQYAAVNTTGYRLFLMANAPAFARDGSVGDYRLIRLITGNLPLPLEMMAQRENEGSTILRVSWKQDLHFSGERLRDELKVIAQSNGLFSEIIPTGFTRRSCGGNFELPVNHKAATHVYLFFESNDHRDYSNSCAFAI